VRACARVRAYVLRGGVSGRNGAAQVLHYARLSVAPTYVSGMQVSTRAAAAASRTERERRLRRGRSAL
jgi:hypothetical protein